MVHYLLPKLFICVVCKCQFKSDLSISGEVCPPDYEYIKPVSLCRRFPDQERRSFANAQSKCAEDGATLVNLTQAYVAIG